MVCVRREPEVHSRLTRTFLACSSFLLSLSLVSSWCRRRFSSLAPSFLSISTDWSFNRSLTLASWISLLSLSFLLSLFPTLARLFSSFWRFSSATRCFSASNSGVSLDESSSFCIHTPGCQSSKRKWRAGQRDTVRKRLNWELHHINTCTLHRQDFKLILHSWDSHTTYTPTLMYMQDMLCLCVCQRCHNHKLICMHKLHCKQLEAPFIS